jgi:5-methylcytosine-specific restriction enzyme A
MEEFVSYVTDEELKREKEKARKLRKSQWWSRKRASGICYFCNRNAGERELTMEHLIPLVRGGKSSRGNLVPACKECNNKKKYMLPIEWEDYLKGIRRQTS